MCGCQYAQGPTRGSLYSWWQVSSQNCSPLSLSAFIPRACPLQKGQHTQHSKPSLSLHSIPTGCTCVIVLVIRYVHLRDHPDSSLFGILHHFFYSLLGVVLARLKGGRQLGVPERGRGMWPGGGACSLLNTPAQSNRLALYVPCT